MKKRFTAVILILSIIATIFCVPVGAQVFPDILGKPYAQMVETLRALEIFMGKGEDNFDPDSTMTRAEMATIALKLNGYGYAEQKDSHFEDVPKKHWASGIVDTAHELGLISGVSETLFMPDAEISYIDAAVILIRILGYDGVAEYYGGYPQGYSRTAVDIGLFDDVCFSQGAAPRWAVAVMTYNALDINLFDMEEISNGNPVYNISDKTILSEYLKIKKTEGVVTQNDVTSINVGESGLSKGRVKIKDDVFIEGDTDVSDYLGYYVTAYYRDDLNAIDNNEIKAFFVKDSNTNVLEIKYDDEMKIVHTGNNLIIDYQDKKRAKTVKISDSKVIYNGMLATASDIDTYFLQTIEDRNFDIKLIDNTNDDTYDVAIINDYSSHVVVNVDNYSKIIRLKKYSSTQMEYMNLEDCDYTIYDDKGKKMALSDIQTNNVVTFVQSFDGTICTIYVSDVTIQGIVKGIEDDTRLINDKEYYIINSLKDKLNDLGLEVLCYLDIDGKIAGYEEATVTGNHYGLLLNVQYSGNISQEYSYKILTNDGIKRYYSDEKIKAYNPATGTIGKTNVSSLIYTAPVSARYTNPEEQYMLWYTDNSANFIEAKKLTDYTAPYYSNLFLDSQEKSKAASVKPIYFETTSSDDKKIKTIYVPDAPGQTKLRTLNNEDRYSYTYRSSYQMVFDSENNTSATPYYKLTDDVTVFSVLATDYTDDNYSASVGTGKLQNGIANKMRLYTTDTTDYVGLVVNYSVLPDEMLANMPYVVVKNIGVDEDNNIVLNGYSEGKSYTATIKEGTRLIERKPNLSLSQYNGDTRITNSNINVGTAFKLYDAATSTTLMQSVENSAVIDINTLKKGDIIIVGKNGGTDICYVEMAMRAEDGIMLITASQSSYYSRMAAVDSLVKGVVTDISDNNEFLIESYGEYNSENRRQVSESENYRYTLLYHDRNIPYDFNKAANLWLYDYSHSKMTLISAASIQVGDVVMIRGAASAPKDCIILRNYPF